MATEDVTLRTRTGAAGLGRAEVVRYGRAHRIGAAFAIVLAGVVVGGATIPIPAVHVFAPWAIPLLAIGLASYVGRVHARVERVRGACPACGGAVEEARIGTVSDEAIWVRCGGCGVPIALELEGAT